MKFNKCLVAVVALLALAVWVPRASAQVSVDMTIETGGLTTQPKPMGNTVNDDTVVFYDYFDDVLSLKTRVVNDDGTLGAIRTIATTISVTEQKRFDVAWNPRSNSYLVVYAKGGKLWGQKVKANGATKGGPREITNYTGKFWTVTATEKKMFALFLMRDGDLVGQLLRKNGKTKKGEVPIVPGGPDGNFPVDSVSTPDGQPFVVYVNYVNGTTSGELRSVRVDGKFNVLGSASFGNQRGLPNSLNVAVFCDYSPDDDVYAVLWRFGSGPSSYAIVDGGDSFVQVPTATPVFAQPREIFYNVAVGRFMIHFIELNFFSGIDHTEYYVSQINADGSVFSDKNFMLRHDYERDGAGIGVSGVGSILVVFSPENGPVGVYARLLIF